MWPEKDLPEDYLKLAKALIAKKEVTEREFVDLCVLAIRCINEGRTTLEARSDMARYIASLWLRHKNIGDIDLLSEIGGQFAEWEIPRTFKIDDELHRPYWEDLQKWVAEADQKY